MVSRLTTITTDFCTTSALKSIGYISFKNYLNQRKHRKKLHFWKIAVINLQKTKNRIKRPAFFLNTQTAGLNNHREQTKQSIFKLYMENSHSAVLNGVFGVCVCVWFYKEGNTRDDFFIPKYVRCIYINIWLQEGKINTFSLL